MARKRKSLTFRKPRLTLSKKGKFGLTGGGLRLGSRGNSVNVSKSGASVSSSAGPVRYNSRRGCSVGLVALLGTGIAVIAGAMFALQSLV